MAGVEMLTSAGVSAVDGNYDLPAGLFGEFREHLADYYGGLDSLKNRLGECSVV